MPEEENVTRDWETAKAETQERQAPEDEEETRHWERGKDEPKPGEN
jgi:hypothetical protein